MKQTDKAKLTIFLKAEINNLPIGVPGGENINNLANSLWLKSNKNVDLCLMILNDLGSKSKSNRTKHICYDARNFLTKI